MRVSVCVLVLLPIVLSANIEERFILDSIKDLAEKGVQQLGFSSFSDFSQQMISYAGSNEVEHACESTACPAFLHTIPGEALVASFEGQICKYCCEYAQQTING